ncbi:MAG: glycosyltransferase family 4 protein [Verrucomicrobia bacterium]|nr:glycosyltransferase family 4 protein [Verrucomicrobiota bacterium]
MQTPTPTSGGAAQRVTVNGRYVFQKVTGQQRYARELVRRFGDRVALVQPGRGGTGIRGHLWEQTVLPFRTGGRLLWSPSATGPLAVERQVVTIHDAISLDHPEWFDWKFGAWYRALLPRLMRRARRVLTVSNFSRDRLLEHARVPAEKFVVTYLGVDPKFHPASAEEIAAVRRKLELPEAYVLTVASLEPRKNMARLLQAWELHRAPFKGIGLVIAGGAGKVFRGTGLGSVSAGVKLTGYVDDADLPALYSGALAFAFPSLCEGFGLPPLEAMACGAPVVTSNTSSLPEICGKAAVLVEPQDVGSIADGLRQVVGSASLRDELRRRGLEHVRPFTWERTAEATWRVLEEAQQP